MDGNTISKELKVSVTEKAVERYIVGISRLQYVTIKEVLRRTHILKKKDQLTGLRITWIACFIGSLVSQ